MRRNQRGMTLAGMFIALAVVGCFLFVGMKLFPMYSEFSAVKDAMEKVAGQPNIKNANKKQAYDALERYFIISYVESVKLENVEVDKKTGVLTVKYEVRRPMAYNISVVGEFEHSVKLGVPGGG